MFRKFAALALLLCLTATACACAKKESPAPDGTGETYTLKYYEIGNQDTSSRAAVQDAINAYLQPKLGAKLEFVLVSWGDWDAKALTALQAGERIPVLHGRLEGLCAIGGAGALYAAQRGRGRIRQSAGKLRASHPQQLEPCISHRHAGGRRELCRADE